MNTADAEQFLETRFESFETILVPAAEPELVATTELPRRLCVIATRRNLLHAGPGASDDHLQPHLHDGAPAPDHRHPCGDDRDEADGL